MRSRRESSPRRFWNATAEKPTPRFSGRN
jgi:hypothetical protein